MIAVCTPLPPRRRAAIPSMAQSFFASWVARREWDAHRYELVHGRIVRRPVLGQACVELARRMHRRLVRAAAGTDVVVLEPRQGLELPTGDTLVPDVAVLSAARWAGATPSAGDLLRVAPELVVEVVRDGTDARTRGETREIYERAGVYEHWVVDPRTRTITRLVRRHDRFELGEVLADGDALRPELLPAFELRAGALF